MKNDFNNNAESKIVNIDRNVKRNINNPTKKSGKISKDREKALDIFTRIEKEKAYSNIIFEQEQNKISPNGNYDDIDGRIIDNEPSDVEQINFSFVRNLVLGTLENKLLLDYYIDRFLKHKLKKKSDDIRNILRLGIYQIMFMQSGKDYAICNDMVAITKKRLRGYEGLVNGILRNVVRSKDTLAPPEGCDVKSISTKYSIDESIINVWLDGYGLDKTIEICEKSCQRAPLFARVNTERINRDEAIDLLKSQGITAFKVKESDRGILIDNTSQAAAVTGKSFHDGLISFQDISSILAVDKLGINDNDYILDMCAAPGGKSTSAAELAKHGKVVAWDVYQHKIDLIKRYAKRCNLSNIEAYKYSALDFQIDYDECFDKVILDPPCSGLGVIRRRPEIRYKSMKDYNLYYKQLSMLKLAANYVKPEGSILYSTCTVNPDENDGLIKNFMSIGYIDDFDILYNRQIFPGDFGADGFYICILKKRG